MSSSGVSGQLSELGGLACRPSDCNSFVDVLGVECRLLGVGLLRVLGVEVLDADVLSFGLKLLVHLHLVHQRRKAAYLVLATSIKADEQTECSCPSFSDLSSHEIPRQPGVFEQSWLKIWPKLCLS